MSVQEETFEQFETFETFEDQPPAAADAEPEPIDDAWETAPMSELPDIKLFGRWSCDDVHVSDMSLAVSCVSYCVEQ